MSEIDSTLIDLAYGGQEGLQLVVGLRLGTIHQADVGDGLRESSTKDSLKKIVKFLNLVQFNVSQSYLHERVWCDFDDDCIGWDVLERLVEEHRRARVVNVVLSRAGGCQVGFPLGLRDGSGDPARRTRLRFRHSCEHAFVHLLLDGEHCGRVEGNSRSVDNLK